MNLDEKLDLVVVRRRELGEAMTDAAALDPQELVRLSKEYADLTPVVESIEKLRRVKEEIGELIGLIGEEDGDADIRALAEDELRDLKDRLGEIEDEIKILLLPKDEADENNAASSPPAPAVTKRRCSRRNCSACTSAMPNSAAGASRSWGSPKPISAAARREAR